MSRYADCGDAVPTISVRAAKFRPKGSDPNYWDIVIFIDDKRVVEMKLVESFGFVTRF